MLTAASNCSSAVFSVEPLLAPHVFVTYFVKWGVAWHDAGHAGNLTDIRFNAVRALARRAFFPLARSFRRSHALRAHRFLRPSPPSLHALKIASTDLVRTAGAQYWNMILILYTTLGFFLAVASENPPAFKALLAYAM